jgi:hypothetical protein
MSKRSLKATLLAAAALSVMALSAPALAFDTVQWNWQLDANTSVDQDVNIDVSTNPTGVGIVENGQTFAGTASATSTVTAPAVSLDPASIPSVSVNDVARLESSATAVGNSASISSDLSANIDSSQVVGGAVTGVSVEDPQGNGNGNGNAFGLNDGETELGIATISATSTLTGAQNLQIDSAAQAIANNLSINLGGPTNDDRTLLANNVQSTFATVTATSTVDAPVASNLTGLGSLTDAFIGSTATAVGNNLQVQVSAPEVTTNF